MFLSTGRIQQSLEILQSIHPFYGTTFLACKEAELPVGRAIPFPISHVETQFLEKYYWPDETSEFFYRVFRVSVQDNKWFHRRKYASSTLQGTRTRAAFRDAFIHETNSDRWGWHRDYIATLQATLAHNSPPYKNANIPAFHLAVWLYRNHNWPHETTSEEMIAVFQKDFHLGPEECDALFDLSVSDPSLYEGPLLQDYPVTWEEIRNITGLPPDAKPEEGAALQFLELRGIGPAQSLRYEPAERLNLITGDNGLGKTFLLETIWWSLTGEWLEYPALPRSDVAKSGPKITFAIGSSHQSFTSTYNWETQTWKLPPGRHALPGVVIYARHDGSFAVWDPARLPQADQRESATKRHVFFNRQGIWNGLQAADNVQQGPWVCNGLIRDWVTWQISGEQYGEHYQALLACLKTLSPADTEPFTPGKPTRLSIRDSRDSPTLRLFGEEVPVVLASAGMQRIIAFAYILVWAWQEHLANCALTRRRPQRHMVLIIDEVEAHLHPRWQRTIVPSLIAVVSQLGASVASQLHIATHSPLVLAAAETIFEEETDNLHHLKVEEKEVILEELPFVKRGKADLWLISDAFGLSQPRSLPAERAINDAKGLQLADTPLPEEVRAVQARLLKYLAPDDEFWPRWSFFAEPFGVD